MWDANCYVDFKNLSNFSCLWLQLAVSFAYSVPLTRLSPALPGFSVRSSYFRPWLDKGDDFMTQKQLSKPIWLSDHPCWTFFVDCFLCARAWHLSIKPFCGPEQHLLLCLNCSHYLLTPLMSAKDRRDWLLWAMQVALITLRLPALAVLQMCSQSSFSCEQNNSMLWLPRTWSKGTVCHAWSAASVRNCSTARQQSRQHILSSYAHELLMQ